MYDLNFLTKALRAARKDEETAKGKRIALEEKIAALVESKEVGQKTVTLEDGSKVTVKRGLNYRADVIAIRDMHYRTISPVDQQRFPCPIKSEIKYTFDIKGYEWYKSNHPDKFDNIAEFVTVTPKKIAVTLQAPKE